MSGWADLPAELRFKILCLLFSNVSVCYAHFFARDQRKRPKKVCKDNGIFALLTVSREFVTLGEVISALLQSARVILYTSSDVYKIAALLDAPYKNQLRYFKFRDRICHHSGDNKLGLGVIQDLFPALRRIDLTLPGHNTAALDVNITEQSRLLPLLAEMQLSPGAGCECGIGRDRFQKYVPFVSESRYDFDIEDEIKGSWLTQDTGKPITTIVLHRLKGLAQIKTHAGMSTWFLSLMKEARPRQFSVTMSGRIHIGYKCLFFNPSSVQHLHNHSQYLVS